jgi:hypothetical protein
MPLFLFVDESGDFDFSATGSRYFIFGVLSTADTTGLDSALAGLRYRLLGDGQELECFHATEDRQHVRDQVFSAVRGCGPADLDFLVIDKRALAPELRDPVTLYPRFAHAVIERVLLRHADRAGRIVVVTDRIPIKRQRNVVEKTFKTSIRQTLGGREFTIVHHSSAAHGGLQAVDYCVWAVQRKWKNGDERSYRLIREWIVSETEETAVAGEATAGV